MWFRKKKPKVFKPGFAPVTTTYRIRRGTRQQWREANPVLWMNEMAGETDFRGVKIGNGVTPWNDLPYSIDPNPAANAWVVVGLQIRGRF